MDRPQDFGIEKTEKDGDDLVRIPVLLPVALDQTYDYLAPKEAQVGPGSFVTVPFGPQTRTGIVWSEAVIPDDKPTKTLDEKKLKTISDVFDVPPLPRASLTFAEWIARYSLTPLGMVARMMMSAPAVFEPIKPRLGVRFVEGASEPAKMTSARKRVLEIAKDGLIRVKSSLAHEAGCGVGVVNGLIANGNFVEIAVPERKFPQPDPNFAEVTFSETQVPAVHALCSAIDGETFSVTLLDGVTGSGKTEVYFEAVARALDAERQVLIILPEIALTSQFMRRFEARFGCPPVEWHSSLSSTERGRVWRGVGEGKVRCVVGARSALFLPYQNLGLIVVDEEHDAGFKQDDRVNYHARDMAVVRGNLGKFPIILASATPALESHVNARTGKYRHVVLESRYSGAELPEISAIDLRTSPPEKGKWLSPDLVDAIVATLERKQQSLLFLNRRGYAPLTLCRACGHRVECPQCTAWLVEHRFRQRLNCHHCGFSLPLPKKCPNCGEPDSMVACGPGVERVAEEVAERFPDARLALLSSDLVPGLTEMRERIKQIEAGEVDIIIGTQIVAKGHHFPNLATVGIVDGDLGLAQGADPRAGERTFQLLHQVTGRAGRAFAEGRGYIQTHQPDHPVMSAIIAGDRDLFLEREIQVRQSGLLPPFGRLAALIVSSRDKDVAALFAQELANRAPPAEKIRILGPAEAPISVIRGRHRWRLLARAPRDVDLQAYLRAWLAGVSQPKGDLRLAVDVDPYNFL